MSARGLVNLCRARPNGGPGCPDRDPAGPEQLADGGRTGTRFPGQREEGADFRLGFGWIRLGPLSQPRVQNRETVLQIWVCNYCSTSWEGCDCAGRRAVDPGIGAGRDVGRWQQSTFPQCLSEQAGNGSHFTSNPNHALFRSSTAGRGGRGAKFPRYTSHFLRSGR